jgi:hypothetical protein
VAGAFCFCAPRYPAPGGKSMNGVLGTGTLTVQTGEIAHLIQVALTPIFLISAIGVTLNVLTNRLSRIVDRARLM